MSTKYRPFTQQVVPSMSIVEFSGFTRENDEVLEVCDDEVGQHMVELHRNWRGLPDITFLFDMQIEAHALFLTLCDVSKVIVEREEENEA
jgi:hypothetical protein